MKKICIITLSIVIGLVFLSNASAADKSKYMDKSKINQMISFYQARLYLLDSEYTILSDIGKDASKRISYLQNKKVRLVQEEKDKNLEYTQSNGFAEDATESIYRNKIDQMISFYQTRLYLLDSEYTILSDIGKDASKMITYLKTQKDQLVQEMKDRKVEFSSAKMNSYIVKKARIGDMS